ncbi:MAG: hypothetical protein U0821_04985 [Chloroflexota bacterium]
MIVGALDWLTWERFDPTRWFADVREPIDHPAYLVLAVVLALLIAAGAYAHFAPDELLGPNRFQQRQIRRLATAVIWLSSIGLVILLFRWQPVPVLSKRIWFYAWLVSAAAVVAYGIYFYRARYRPLLAEHLETERRQRWIRQASGSSRGSRRRRRR